MKQATIGVLINFVMTITAYIVWQETLSFGPWYSEVATKLGYAFYLSVASLLICGVGLVLIFLHDREKGAILIIAGSIVFLPIGLVSALAGAKLLIILRGEKRNPQLATLDELTQATQNQPKPDTGSSAFYTQKYIFLTTLAIAAGVALSLTNQQYWGVSLEQSISYAILGTIAVAWFISFFTPAATINEYELKIGMGLTPQHNLLLSEITDIARDSNKLIVFYRLAESDESGHVVIELALMTAKTQQRMIGTLVDRLKHAPMSKVVA